MSIIKHKITKEVEDITDIICDSCGKSCKVMTQFEYMTLEAFWGYHSRHDGEIWKAYICQDCVEAKLDFIGFSKND